MHYGWTLRLVVLTCSHWRNPSSHLRFAHSPILEPEFLGELARCPPLIEWDTHIPTLAVLRGEAHTAERFIQRTKEAVYASVV